jgi:anti-sigma factor RsiW
VAALVYRHRLHTVNVFVWPEEGAPAAARVESLRGFALRSWHCAGMRYWAIGDVAPRDLEELAEASCRG